MVKNDTEYEETDLFGARALGPEGFRYQPDFITATEEAALVGHLAQLPFEPFDFHGHLANRQVVGFGYRYDYASRTVRAAPPIPVFLQPLRQKIAAFTGLDAEAFQQVLINEYPAPALAGTGTGRTSSTSLASRCQRPACSDFAKRPATAGSESRCPSSLAPPT